MPLTIVMLSPEHQALMREIPNHPKLVEEMKGCETDMDQLCTAAAYVKIILDGTYDANDLNRLYARITERLFQLRTGIVTTRSLCNS